MSYSFSVRGATRNEVLKKIADELSTVAEQQPTHSADRLQAQMAADVFLSILPVATDQDYYVSMSGSVGWIGTPPDHKLVSAGVSVSACLVAKK